MNFHHFFNQYISCYPQAEIWSTQFNDWIWRSSIKLLGRRFIWTKIIGEAGGNFLPSAQAIEQQLSTAFQHASQSFFFCDSDFASLMSRGFHQMEQALPLHMRQENFLHIKNNVERIKAVNTELSTKLTKKDRAIIYRIHAGYINKAYY